MRENRRLFAALIGWAGLSLFFAAGMHFHWGGTAAVRRLDNIGETVAALVAATACGVAAWRHQRRTRIAWALIGTSALSSGLGQSVSSYYELVRGQLVPLPSLADLGYLGAVPLAVAGVLCFPSAPNRGTSLVRTVLDALLTAGSLFIISWGALLGMVYRTGSGGVTAQLINPAYPAGAIVIATIMLIPGPRAPPANRPPPPLLPTPLTPTPS